MVSSNDSKLNNRLSTETNYDAVVIGAGFAGLYMLYRLRDKGLSVRVYDAADGVGGTWFWNRYPGARCDVESLEYSYQFSDTLQQEWEWTERYAAQPEILGYIQHVADRFDLLRDISLNTRILAAHFDDQKERWDIETDEGKVVSAKYFILATGPLSSPFIPDIPGIDRFVGEQFHTGRWPKNHIDFSGKKVGVIGTGSSAVQCIPIIAEQADQLTVFQRTATYTVPAGNRPLDPELQSKIKADYSGLRDRNDKTLGCFGSAYPTYEDSALDVSDEQRQQRYENRWSKVGGLLYLGAYNDLLTNDEANQTAAEFVRQQIRDTVNDPSVAEILTPQSLIGCKRLCSGTNYYEAYNRSNVRLIDISKSAIEEITEHGLRTSEEEFDLDYIVFATGFDAMTGAILNIDIRGRSGQPLQEKWSDGPVNYLGAGTEGFPNMFIVIGPGNPSVLTNMVCTIEHHVEWIVECISYLRANAISMIEVTSEAEQIWVSQVNELAENTIFTRCNSWYVGANIPGKPRVFMPYLGLPGYKEKCAEVAANKYMGFTLS